MQWDRVLSIYDTRDGERLVLCPIPEDSDNPLSPLFLLKTEYEEFGKAQWLWAEKHNPKPDVPLSEEVVTQMGMDAARYIYEGGSKPESIFTPDEDLRVEWTIVMEGEDIEGLRGIEL